MANTIQLRRSATANAVPTTTQLQLGELAINTYDGKLYLKKNVSGTESIVQIGSNADQLGGFVRDRFVYGDNTTGSINSFTGDGGVGANSLSRSCFYRDNSGQFGALGVHIQHPQNNAYALQIASSAYENGPLRYRVENNGTWSSPFTILDSANYNSYSPTLTGTGASGTWGISISGSAPTLTTARTLTIGNTGKAFNGSGNVSWSLAEIGAQAAGNYVTTDTTQTITGVKTFTGTVDLRKQLIASYDEYQYAWGGNQDKEWKKVAVLSSTATDGWRGTSGQIIVYDEVGNHGNAARVEHRARFSVVYSQNSTPTDTALIDGSPGFGNVIRLQKIGVRNYELQVRQEIDWRLMGATLQIDFDGGDTTAITTTQVPPNGAAGISTVAAGGLIENFNISGNAASATSATSANTAATLATARNITIGNTTRSFNGSANVSWTIGDIGAEERHGLGNPRSNLGDPTVREMALFDAQFNNKTELYDIANLWFETSTDNVTWTALAGVNDTMKRRFLTGDAGTNIIIPYGTAYFRIRMRATSYVYLNALYAYWSSNGHSTQVQMFRKHDSGSWEQHTNSNWLVNAWPGHLFLPFSTIPWNPTATLGTHFHEIYALFIPNWNATYPSNPINLFKGQFWGGYPAGKRNIYSTDEFGVVTFPQAVNTLAGDVTAAGDLVSNFSSGDEGGQIRLAKPVTNTSINTGVNIDIYQNKLRVYESGGSYRGVSIDLTTAANTVGSRFVIANASNDIDVLGGYLINPNLKSYTEHKVTNATTTGTVTLDLSTSNVFHNTLTGNTTFAFSNPPANTKVFSFTIITVQDATGGRTITWPASKKFAGGVTPPPTTAANAVDVWSVMTYDGGTSYIVSLSVKDAK